MHKVESNAKVIYSHRLKEIKRTVYGSACFKDYYFIKTGKELFHIANKFELRGEFYTPVFFHNGCYFLSSITIPLSMISVL